MRRRRFALSVAVAAIAPVLLTPGTTSAQTDFRARSLVARHGLQSFAGYVDTLFPDDETPGARGLGVDARLVVHAESVPNYLRLLTLGCQWLDRNSGGPGAFGRLPEQARVRGVEALESTPAGEIPRQFFDRTLADLGTLYYRRPEVWSALGMANRPQPLGFIDHAQAPPDG